MRPTVSKCEPLTRSLSAAPLYLYLNLRVGLWTFLVETICSPYSDCPRCTVNPSGFIHIGFKMLKKI